MYISSTLPTKTHALGAPEVPTVDEKAGHSGAM
jgi:hypothetical protein